MNEQIAFNAEQEAFLAYMKARREFCEARDKEAETQAAYYKLSNDAYAAFLLHQEASASFKAATDAQIAAANTWANVRGY
jgi:hypothetical protein